MLGLDHVGQLGTVVETDSNVPYGHRRTNAVVSPLVSRTVRFACERHSQMLGLQQPRPTRQWAQTAQLARPRAGINTRQASWAIPHLRLLADGTVRALGPQ